MTQLYIINQKENAAEILLYGYIGNWGDADSNSFVSDFKKLEAIYPQINVRINSGGGDVFEGITIYNTLKNSKAIVHTYIDGLAASMGSVIAMAGQKIFMSRYAKLMIHKVSGSVNGDAEKLRETASMMDDVEKSLMEIYAARTGNTIENIQSEWMQTGKNKWFNASESLQNKLVDEVFDGVVKKAAPKTKNPQDLWNYYNNQIENNLNIKKMEELKPFITHYRLDANANETDVLNAMQLQSKENGELKLEIERLKADNIRFENQLKDATHQKVKELIDNAIKATRITEEQRLPYTQLAEANYEATKMALNAIAPYKSIASQLHAMNDDEPEYKTFREYQEKAPELLAAMKENDPAKFKALYKKEYGTQPKLTAL